MEGVVVKRKLQVIYIGGRLELSFDGEVFYEGPNLLVWEILEEIRKKYNLDLTSAKAFYLNHEYLGDN